MKGLGMRKIRYMHDGKEFDLYETQVSKIWAVIAKNEDGSEDGVMTIKRRNHCDHPHYQTLFTRSPLSIDPMLCNAKEALEGTNKTFVLAEFERVKSE